MSWIPLVGSGLGSMLGGHLSDILSRNTGGWGFGRAGRPIVAGTSALVSTPFVILALLAGYPGCFLYFIPSGWVSLLCVRLTTDCIQTGEMYLGASLALLSDITPISLIVPSVALFMFIITIIGGNAPLLVPLVLSLRSPTHHIFQFQAAAPVGSPLSSSVLFEIERRSGTDLQTALVILFLILYLLSALLYYLCAYSLWVKKEKSIANSYESLESTDENPQN
jgi:hypothetical protein